MLLKNYSTYASKNVHNKSTIFNQNIVFKQIKTKIIRKLCTCTGEKNWT